MARTPITVKKTAFYPYPPEHVWVALTDPRALAEWLMPNDFKPEKGHRFRFQVDPAPMCGGITECTVLEIEPPRFMSWEWIIHRKPPKAPLPPTVVTWRLEPEGTGTRLHFEHSGLEVIPFVPRFMMAMGWGTMVKRWIPKVVARVRDDAGDLDFEPGAIPLEKRCYKTKTIPDEMVR